jgi:hypothetical protein
MHSGDIYLFLVAAAFGGIIRFGLEYLKATDSSAAMQRIEGIAKTLDDIFVRRAGNAMPTNRIADAMARELIAGGGAAPLRKAA